jgi:hypothetical protein
VILNIFFRVTVFLESKEVEEKEEEEEEEWGGAVNVLVTYV